MTLHDFNHLPAEEAKHLFSTVCGSANWQAMMMQSFPKTFVEMFGFNHAPARLSEAVVVVIDMQREYLDGAVPLPDIKSTIAATVELLRRAREYATPVIHVINEGPPDGLLFKPNGLYVAELEEVAAEGNEIILTKHLPNAFAGTTLHQLITQTGRKQIIIAGCRKKP
ncbi:MAG: isochorismatase family protein [Chitinophagaceae bacterium]|nr:MAG: isochorismatase family protein [Chitinophagaceae bacterium]